MAMKIRLSIQDRITGKLQKIFDALPDFLKKPDPMLNINPTWLTGVEANIKLDYLLGSADPTEERRRWNHASNYGIKGYYKDANSFSGDIYWMAFDNSRGECWVEWNFKTEENCIRWLNGQDLRELQD